MVGYVLCAGGRLFSCSSRRLLQMNKPILSIFNKVSTQHNPVQTPYQVLGVKETADLKEIKEAFFAKSKENHPDLNPETPDESAAKFQEIVEAYEFLSDSDKKSQLDLALQRSPSRDGSGQQGRMDWRANLRRDDVSMDEAGRKVDVDMSLEAMKRRWSLYKKHWEGEEKRLKELDELKTAFRIRLDEKRKMFEHLSPEEQTQFKESIRLFRHPKFSKGVTQVILTDKENENRAEKKAAAGEGAGGSVTSWLWSKLSQSIHPEYDSTVMPSKEKPSCQSTHCDKSVTYDDGAGYTTTNQRKKSFANHINNRNHQRAESHQTKRHYSSTVNLKNDASEKSKTNLPKVTKIDESFDPYEYVREKGLTEVTSGSTSGVGLAGNVLQAVDFERETKRLEVAVDKVARRDQALQMKLYKSTFNPKRRYDDDDPNFKEEKKYFDDELNPLREVKNYKNLEEMSTKEIVEESVKSFKESVNPRKILQDGGEQALKDGQRFRSEYKMNEKRVAAILVFLLGLTALTYALDAGYIDIRSPSDEYLEQAVQQRQQANSQKDD